MRFPSPAQIASGSVAFTPTGGIAATDVQAALAEIDGEKLIKPARIVTVSPAGHGGQYTSIQAAVDSITDAATGNRYVVLVYPGTYSEWVQTGEYIDVIGVDRDTCIVSYTGDTYPTVVVESHSRVSNLTILRSHATPKTAVALADLGVGGRVDHCKLVSNQWGILCGATFEDYEIDHNWIDAPNPLWLSGADNCHIHHNTCEYNSSATVTNCVGGIDNTGFSTGAANCVIAHNTFRIVHSASTVGGNEAYGVYLTRGGNVLHGNLFDITTTREQISAIAIADDAETPDGSVCLVTDNVFRLRTTHATPTDTYKIKYMGAYGTAIPSLKLAGNTFVVTADNALSGSAYGAVLETASVGSLDLATATDAQGISEDIVTITYLPPE